MCAINGFTFEDETLVKAMDAVTAHRGPDSTGVYCGAGVSLGHNRLSIIDLSPAGAQPMRSADGTVVVVYNGEVYNFEELRQEVGPYAYKGHSDTEVILAAYKKWGNQAFGKLNGIFALALWDSQKGELILARDRAGVKPLYYYHNGTKLIFSSEIKALLEHDIPRVLDQESLLHYLRVQYVPGPRTMFKDMYKLMPGHTLMYKSGTIVIESFATPDAPYAEDVSDRGLREVVGAAVRRQLVSDRPIGVYLSGGFDSSIVLACATAAHQAIDTFSVGFDLGVHHPRTHFFNADMELARKTAAYFGSTHHEFYLSQNDLVPLFEKMIWHMDEPVANATALPMLYLAEQAKKTVAVVLGGEGGDELFGGYERYRVSLVASYWSRLPATLRGALARSSARMRALNTPAGVKRFARFMFQKDDEIARVLAVPYDTHCTERYFKDTFFTPVSNNFERQLMDTDRHSWLVDEALVRTDKMAMASGLEVRVPFLDNEVVAYAARIPTGQKVTPWDTKWMLKRAFRSMLPAHLYGQEKRGWFSPGGEWIKDGAFGQMVEEVLSPSYYAESAGLFNWPEVRTMLHKHRTGEEYHMVMLWALLVLQAWMKKFNVRVES